MTDSPRVEWKVLALQLFVLPAAIVAACVGVFLLFGSLAGDRKDAREILEEIRRNDVHSVFDKNARWHAARDLPGRIERERDALRLDPSFREALVALFEDTRYPDARMRGWMALSLGKLGDPAAAPAIEKGLSDAGEEAALTRYTCAWALGALQAAGSVPALAPLLDDPDPSVRQMTAYALGAIGTPAAATALAKALTDERPAVRWTAAVWLGRRRDPAALSVLRTLLAPGPGDPRPEPDRDQILEQAARAAGALGDPSLKAALESLAADPSPRVALAAQEALIAYGDPSRTLVLPPPAAPGSLSSPVR